MHINKKIFISLAWIASLHILTLVFLSLFRLVEYVTLHGMVADAEASVLPAFVRGVWFDNVVACYVTIVPLVLSLLAATFGAAPQWMRKAATWWYGVLGATLLMASAANIPYFAYFFKNINSSIFEWFGYAGTTAGMVTGEKSYFLYIALYFAATAAYIYNMVWLRRRFDRMMEALPYSTIRPRLAAMGSGIVLTACATALCLFGIRGRTGYNPIKISQAYYCSDAFLNQLGINPAFNLLTSALDDMRKENRELRLMSYPEAIAVARQSLGITSKCDSTHVMRRYIAATDSAAPGRGANVVVILMESMSANFLETFGNQQHLTPTLDSLYHHSMAFTHCYSAGIHTNHGMTAALYSFPALMFRNLMKGTVTPRRDGLPTVMHKEGYRTMFFMTHEAQYDNMKAFFATNGYDDIYSQEDYPKNERVNAFGVSDHFLFGYALDKLNRQAATGKPFFATLLTVSNHPPFVIPTWFKPHSKEPDTQIVEYADWCIGDFLKKASREPWYKNTIFVVMADHGKIVGKVNGELPESYNHIPLLIFGKGVTTGRVDKLAGQVDLMPTLLSLMGCSYQYDGFGIDQTKQERDMIFYSADNQIVARSKNNCYIFNPKLNRSFCYKRGDDGKLHDEAFSDDYEPLRRYAFAMTQTAQWMIKQQQ